MDRLKYHEFRFYFGSASLVGNNVPPKLKLGKILRDIADATGRTSYLRRAVETAGSHVAVNEAAQKNLLQGAGNAELAWAFYYWLHVDMPHLEALLEIDRDLLSGHTFEEVAGRPVVMDTLSEPAPQTTDLPELYLKTVIPDSRNWLSPFNEDSLPFVGRQTQKELLDQFAAKVDAFSVWALVGPSGSGKTRLTANWLRTSNALRSWYKGFLVNLSTEGLSRWRPERPTFIVIDDLFVNGEVIAAIFDRCLALNRMGILRHPVRLLIIDRMFPAGADNLLTDERWSAVFQRTIDMDDRTSVLHRPSPLSLADADDQTGVLQSILRSASGIGDDGDYRLVATLEQLRNMSGADRPLFAALIGRSLSIADTAANWTRKDLIRYYLSGADRLPWLNDEIDGDLVGCFVAAATILRGTSLQRLISLLPPSVSVSASRVATIRGHAIRIVGGCEEDELPALQPDILGETFFLLLLDRLENSPPTMALLKRMCSLSADDEGEKETAFVSFFQGLIANLIAEGADKFSIQKAWSSIERFLANGKNESGIDAFTEGVARMAMQNIIFRNTVDYIQYDPAVDYNFLYSRDPHSIPMGIIIEILEHINWRIRFHGNDHIVMKSAVDIASIFSFHEEDWPHLLGICARSGLASLTEALIKGGLDVNEERLGGSTALMVASELGNVEVVRLLLDSGADPNRGNKVDGSTSLMWASQGGYIEVVEALLDHGADPDGTRFGDGGAAIHIAAAHGHTHIVEKLVHRGADINQTTAEGVTALAVACALDDKAVISCLLRLGADPDRGDETGDNTPLFLACKYGYLEVAELLIDAGALVEGTRHQPLIQATIGGHLPVIKLLHAKGGSLDAAIEGGSSPVFIAAVHGDINCLTYLIEHGAGINPQAKDSGIAITALAAALANGEDDAADLLIRHGADPNAGYVPGAATPLGFACTFGHLELARRLLDAGADCEAVGMNGWTPLTSACSEGHCDVADILIAKGASANFCDGAGRHPFLCAAANGNPELVKLLLRQGCDPNTTSEGTASSALGFACAHDNVDAVKVLLDAGADRRAVVWEERLGPFHTAAQYGSKDVLLYFLLHESTPDELCPRTGMSALTLASMGGHITLVDELIGRKADVDITSEGQKSTPLMWAAQEGHLKVVSRLLDAGASPDKQRIPDGKTALHVASSHGRTSIAEALIKRKASVNIQCSYGTTPLMSAASAGNSEVVSLLVKHGADMTIRDRRGLTARGHALSLSFSASDDVLVSAGAPRLNLREITHLIRLMGVGVYTRTFHTQKWRATIGQALLEATAAGRLSYVSNITKFHDIKDYQDETGVTALMIAVSRARREIVELLIEKQADLNRSDSEGNTAVTIARAGKHDEILEMLLQAGARDQFWSSWHARNELSGFSH